MGTSLRHLLGALLFCCGSTNVVVAPGGSALSCSTSTTLMQGTHALTIVNPDGIFARKASAVNVWGLHTRL